jgi:hypothetical protein
MDLNKHMKNIITLFCLFFLTQPVLTAQKDSVKIGLYITNLYDFNLADGSYVAEFWTWCLYKKDSLDFKETQEITKSKKTAFSNYALQKKGGLNWAQKKCTTTVLQDWDVRNFPFDHQVLTINLEETILDTTAMYYVADTFNSKINESLSLDEWHIDGFKIKTASVRYNTTYGDPELTGQSVYPAVCATVNLTRQHSWTTFIKLVTGLYVAFLISLMVFRIMPPDSESRIGLAVGGLFAAVGNKYIVETIVPTTTQNTMIDNIHNVTFGAILLIVIMTIYISGLYFNQKESKAYFLDRMSFWGILGLFVALNGYLIVKGIWLF